MRFGLFKRVQLGEILPIGISWRVDKSRRPAELGIFIVVPVDIRPVEEYADENGYFMYCRGRRLTLAGSACRTTSASEAPSSSRPTTVN